MSTTEKARLRDTLGAARRARTPDDLAAARARVATQVLARVDAEQPDCVAAYEPLRTEPGSTQILTALHERGVRVLVPLIQPDRDLDWVTWTPDGIGSALGVTAIGAAGLVLVPALAVALDGTRLGRGGGSYDRALGRCSAGALTAALLFEDEVLPALPRDPWDRPVDFALTPQGWQRVGRNTDDGEAR